MLTMFAGLRGGTVAGEITEIVPLTYYGYLILDSMHDKIIFSAVLFFTNIYNNPHSASTTNHMVQGHYYPGVCDGLAVLYVC